jgi:lactobin A/cerein 7B family class IIb bacteriocin
MKKLSATELRLVTGGFLPAVVAGGVLAAYTTNYFANRSDGHSKGLKNNPTCGG